MDELPTCTIDDVSYVVKQASKGIYYIDIELNDKEYDENQMLYDTWGNIKYNGREIKDVVLDFVTKLPSDYYQFGIINNNDDNDNRVIPTLYGIKHNERIKRGDIRKVNIDCRVPYTSDQQKNMDGIEYRLYILSGEKQIDVIDWQKAERSCNGNYFMINTNELFPSRYYIDIKVIANMECIVHYKALQFDIADNITEYYN